MFCLAVANTRFVHYLLIIMGMYEFFIVAGGYFYCEIALIFQQLDSII